MDYPDTVVDVKVLAHLKLQVLFFDGTTGTVEFSPTMIKGVFQPLSDPTFFNEVSWSDGFVTWPGELDIAPDAMHRQLKTNGYWLIS